MSKFAEQQKAHKTDKEHAFLYEKMRREKLSGLCFDMAKIFCAGLVVSNLSPLLIQESKQDFNYPIIILGILITIGFVYFGNRLLNNNR